MLITALGVVGCAEPAAPAGDNDLGIARFELSDSVQRTTLTGFDENGAEIAKIDLVHGRFTLSAPFTEDYDTADVDGRKLNIEVLGHRLNWETAGYEPTLELPMPPEHESQIAELLAQPYVTAMLGRWQIGFQTMKGADETAYVTNGSYRGDSPQRCQNAASCGTAYNGTINTCGGGATSIDAVRATQHSGTNCGLYSSSYQEVLLSQCCPAGSGGQSNTWFAQKACPTTTNNATICGTRTSGACKACPTYPTDATGYCAITLPTTSVGTCGLPVYNISYTFARCFSQCGPLSMCDQDDGCGNICTWYDDGGGKRICGSFNP